jgi:hypothetical protein
MTLRARTATLLFAAPLALAACASADAIDLELVPDPNVNDEHTIVERISTIVTIVDSEPGLYPPGPETEGPVRLANADADEALELVATVPVSDHLPLVRLERADLPDVPLDVRFLGQDGPGIVAEGRVVGARFGDGRTTLRVPFNIRPEHLPPRVVEVYPPDGTPLQGCNLGLIILLFSKPVDPSTVFAAGSVLVNGEAPVAIRVPTSGLSAEITPPMLDHDGVTLRYTLTVSSAVTDVDGQPLDQIPSEPGPEDYSVGFVMPCTPATGTPDPPRCGDVIEPPPPGEPVCPGMPRFMCVDGFCQPQSGSCGSAECADGAVCDPATGLCVLDCRAWGDLDVCPAERPVCDAASGACTS